MKTQELSESDLEVLYKLKRRTERDKVSFELKTAKSDDNFSIEKEEI